MNACFAVWAFPDREPILLPSCRTLCSHTPAHLCETSGIQDLSKRSPEQQMAAMAEAVINMGNNINQFYKDVKYRRVSLKLPCDTAQWRIMTWSA